MGLQPRPPSPFILHEAYKPLRQAPLEEKVRALRDPTFRQKLLVEEHAWDPQNILVHFLMTAYHKMFPMAETPNYEPPPKPPPWRPWRRRRGSPELPSRFVGAEGRQAAAPISPHHELHGRRS